MRRKNVFVFDVVKKFPNEGQVEKKVLQVRLRPLWLHLEHIDQALHLPKAGD
jgi:hypothetical protein